VILKKFKVQPLRKKYVEQITKQYYNDSKDHNSIQIPAQKDESDYTLDALSEQQQVVVLALIGTIVKFLNNDTKYKPLRAIVMGCGGTGKSFIINTIISIAQKMTQQNDTIQVGAPTGAAAFNIQRSTLHRLLGINVGPQMETNSIRKQGFPIWEYPSLPAHFHMVITIWKR
jgi:hypothetical protein